MNPIIHHTPVTKSSRPILICIFPTDSFKTVKYQFPQIILLLSPTKTSFRIDVQNKQTKLQNSNQFSYDEHFLPYSPHPPKQWFPKDFLSSSSQHQEIEFLIYLWFTFISDLLISLSNRDTPHCVSLNNLLTFLFKTLGGLLPMNYRPNSPGRGRQGRLSPLSSLQSYHCPHTHLYITF